MSRIAAARSMPTMHMAMRYSPICATAIMAGTPMTTAAMPRISLRDHHEKPSSSELTLLAATFAGLGTMPATGCYLTGMSYR